MGIKKEKLQWHPAFCSATELEFREDRDNLEFFREYPLSKQPLKIDLTVIKKKPGVKIKNEIGHIFETHNIIEYKNPYDNLNIDTYYKALSYVCLFKSQGKHVDEIKANDISLTLVRDSKPQKLIEMLELSGLLVEKKNDGIYYIKGNPSIPKQQIIVTSEFENGHYFLKLLSRKFSLEDGRKAIRAIEVLHSKADIENRDAVFQVSFIANSYIFSQLKKEDNMCEAFFELFKEEIAAKVAAAEEVIRNETEARVRSETEARVRKESERKIKELESEIARLKKLA